MIALDTNVLVRFLVEDDKAQTARAKALVRDTLERGGELFIADVVLCEVVWVLHVSYRIQRQQITETLQRLLQARHLRFRDSDLLERALAAYQTGKGDFADYLIRELATHAGCGTVATFDKALPKERGFKAP